MSFTWRDLLKAPNDSEREGVANYSSLRGSELKETPRAKAALVALLACAALAPVAVTLLGDYLRLIGWAWLADMTPWWVDECLVGALLSMSCIVPYFMMRKPHNFQMAEKLMGADYRRLMWRESTINAGLGALLALFGAWVCQTATNYVRDGGGWEPTQSLIVLWGSAMLVTGYLWFILCVQTPVEMLNDRAKKAAGLVL